MQDAVRRRCTFSVERPGWLENQVANVRVAQIGSESLHDGIVALPGPIVFEGTLDIVCILPGEDRKIRRLTDTFGAMAARASLRFLLPGGWISPRLARYRRGSPTLSWLFP